MDELRRYECVIIIDPSSQIKGYNESIKRIENFINEKEVRLFTKKK